MKTQRRQDTHADTLSRQMHGFPELVRQNASKIFLAATLIILVIVLVRYRNESARQRLATARAALARAHGDLAQVQNVLMTPNAPPQTIATVRNQATAQCLGDLGDVLGNTDESDTLLRAEAYATRGDLYWALANGPVFPEAATQPSLAPADSPDALLGKAEADYKHILDVYSNEATARATALFGLAAIAENRHNWDEAKKRYDEVDKSDLPDIYKENARSRGKLLDRLKQPVQIGPLASSQTTQPATAPSTNNAATTASALVAPVLAAPIVPSPATTMAATQPAK